ncbi:MAG: hypothetical protein Tsb0020_07170 [Haliangiales bacterium]
MEDTATMFEKLFILAVDKVLIGGMLLWLGYLLNRRFALFKSSQALMDSLLQQRRKLDQDLEVERRQRKLDRLERQLSGFYWPFCLCLQKDNVMWQRVASLTDDNNQALPAAASEIVERSYVLPNHGEAVALVERHIHLVDDDKIVEELLGYVKHVAVYQALRSSDELKGVNPEQLGEPYPEHLFALVDNKRKALQAEYNRLQQAGLDER